VLRDNPRRKPCVPLRLRKERKAMPRQSFEVQPVAYVVAASCQVVYGDPSPSCGWTWSRGLGQGRALQGCG
jgi:hypothetical protein